MRSPAAAIAWEFLHRHRRGLIVISGYLLILATIRALFVAGGRVQFGDEQNFALAVLAPITSSALYFLAVFTHGLDGDIAARRSMYPARLFTLPVTSSALAGWPMLYGSLAMALLWLSARFLGVWPAKKDIPLFWPALLGVIVLAWTQALTWMPYPLRGLRVTITLLWLCVIEAVVLLSLALKASEPVVLALLAPHLPFAFLTARHAVSRARRGDMPDWRGVSVPLVRRKHDPFSSSARAQAWFEWRQYGRSLPAMVAVLLPFELAMLFLFRGTPVIVFETLAGVLLTPPFMAVFVAATVSKSNPSRGDSYGLTPFIATRPLTSASLIAAKMKTALRSTLIAWLFVLAAIPIALRLSGTSAVVLEWIRDLIKASGTPRAIAMLTLLIAILVTSTWKQLVSSLYIGLTGREWAVKASVFVALFLVTILLPLAHWTLTNRRAIAALWTSLPWIAAILVCIKLAAAAWVITRLHHDHLLSDRTLLLGAICWDSAVLALYGLLTWLLPALIFRRYLLALVAILAIPLTRLAAAPLALHWNRHR